MRWEEDGEFGGLMRSLQITTNEMWRVAMSRNVTSRNSAHLSEWESFTGLSPPCTRPTTSRHLKTSSLSHVVSDVATSAVVVHLFWGPFLFAVVRYPPLNTHRKMCTEHNPVMRWRSWEQRGRETGGDDFQKWKGKTSLNERREEDRWYWRYRGMRTSEITRKTGWEKRTK